MSLFNSSISKIMQLKITKQNDLFHLFLVHNENVLKFPTEKNVIKSECIINTLKY